MRTPASLIALPLVAGATAGLALPDFPGHSLALCAAGGALLCLVAGWGLFGDSSPTGVVVAVLAGGVLSGLSLGVSAARAAYTPALLEWFDARGASDRDDPALIDGTIREDGSMGAGGVSLTIDVGRVNATNVRGGVRLSVGGASAAQGLAEWRAGRRVRLPGSVRRPAIHGNPGVPDEGRALARRGIVLVGSVKSAALVEVVAKGSALDEAAGAARAWARRRLARHVGRWAGDSGAVAAAILIGDRSGLSDDDQRRLQDAGTYHVIAISGGNIAILTALLLVSMRGGGLRTEYAAALSIAVLLFYGQLTGWSASVARAVTAAVIVLSARMLDHRGPAMNALAVAAVAGVAVSPVAVFDPGFVLSFGATLGILLGAARLMPGGGFDRTGSSRSASSLARTAISGAAAVLAATVCAELALAPVTASVFSKVTFAGLALNFAAIPLMTIVQGASMLTLAAAPVLADAADIAGYVAHLAAHWLVGSAGLVDLVPWLARDVSPPAWGLVGAYYLCCVACLVSRRWVRAGSVGIAVSGALILTGPLALTRDGVPAALPGRLRVAFLDVGQGDATLILTPSGHRLLVDAGGLAGSGFDMGGRVVAPSLRAFGVRRLDTLVLTHGDPDHVGGAPTLLRRFRPAAVWEGVPVPPHPALRQLTSAMVAAHGSWRTVQAGDREGLGPVEIRVLHPPLPDWERQRVRNDDSIVLDIRMGDVSVLLPGDVEGEGERTIIPALAPGRIAIVKAPHHGSATSSGDAFVRAARPSAVVFSSGRGNRFGHPAPAVVERYRRAGAEMFRTNEDGAVVLDTDGRSVEMWTWSGRRVTYSASAAATPLPSLRATHRAPTNRARRAPVPPARTAR